MGRIVVAERGELAAGSTARAMGGVRQQFSTAAEVLLARESVEFLATLGPAMADPVPRWTSETIVDASLFGDRLERLAHRYPPAAGATSENAWAGLYDMTPDAHRSSERSPTASTQPAASAATASCSRPPPAVGRALAELILRGESSLDLRPYALERFEAGAVFPETLVL